MKFTALIVVVVCVAAAAPLARAQQASIVSSKHNLSAGGPGLVRAASEEQICIFCHTPHNASPVQPAWNRNIPVSAYTVYTSDSLTAAPGQPTGSSKLCLSCHDGTIAVGSVLSREQPISMAGGITTLPPGTSNLGTDLSDDHPVSFRFDSSLAARNTKLRDPGQLPESVRLDARQEMQCTSCHDPHSDRWGKFLVMDNADSQLCTTCHNQGMTSIAAHNSCSSCHVSHSAPSGAHLLRAQTASATCFTCHAGDPGQEQGANVKVEMAKISSHDTTGLRAPPPRIGQGLANRLAITQVECSNCHEPHTMLAGSLGAAPGISPNLGRIDGVNTAGAAVPVAQYQYEVCFKCHAERNAVTPVVSRQIFQTNTRLEFAPSAVSFHPVQVAGKNTFVPSLRPGLTTASIIYCTDCHASDTAGTGGAAARGPHGSNNPPLLRAPYSTTDTTPESATSYALCYACHDRSSILADQSFTKHHLHIVDQRTPCSACHDAHGISSAQGNTSNNSKLMNFDNTIVTPDPVTGKLQYVSLGPGAGECYLNCHGVAHSPLSYPTAASPLRDAARRTAPAVGPSNTTPARVLPPPTRARTRR